MKIGITTPLDISYFLNYFTDSKAKAIIKENTRPAVATSVHTLIQSYLNNHHFVRIFTLATNTFYIKGNGIEIYGIKSIEQYPVKFLWGDFVNANTVKKALKNNISDLDVLHAHWTYTYAYAASAYTNQIPVFCTVRDWATYIWKIESLKNKITWSFRVLMNELVFKNRNIHFISNSPYTAARIEKKYGLKTPIIPNPLKDSFLKIEDNNSITNLELLCISSSNDKRKNVKTLLMAFKKLSKKYPEAHLSLVGGPFTETNEEMKLWKSEALLNNVTLVGLVKHNELKNYFDKANIFITPSLEETFGNTLLESLARKVPIVAGKYSGAIPYVLRDGEAGFLCDVSKVDDIYDTIEYVYTNPIEANKKVKYGFELLKLNYLGTKVMEKHIDLYNTVIRE